MEGSRYEESLRLEISQGDIFSNVPFADWVTHPDGATGISSSKRHHAMLLTFDCEFDKNNVTPVHYVLVAKIVPLAMAPKDRWAMIRKERSYDIFYLPEAENFQESFVDFRQMERMAKDGLLPPSSVSGRILSIKSPYRIKLRLSLAQFFGMTRDSEVDPVTVSP